MLESGKCHSYAYSSFNSHEGCKETIFVFTADDAIPFIDALTQLNQSYDTALSDHSFDKHTLVFSRLFLSDIHNQINLLRSSALYRELMSGAFSIVGQCPSGNIGLTLLSYHIQTNHNVLHKRILESHLFQDAFCGIKICSAHYQQLWLVNNVFVNVNGADLSEQTSALFRELKLGLQLNGFNEADNIIRTWLFIRDIDVNYNTVNQKRSEIFKESFFNDLSRYPASTGIGADLASSNSAVAIDSLSVAGTIKKQVIKMRATQCLCSPTKYGATFERGTRVVYGDRSHMYISGTASIDINGEILGANDVLAQTTKTLDNIASLLSEQGSGLDDLFYCICYLRNPKDHKQVISLLENRLPHNTPLICVHAPICRPQWLIELEGLAIKPENNNFPPFFE